MYTVKFWSSIVFHPDSPSPHPLKLASVELIILPSFTLFLSTQNTVKRKKKVAG